MQNFTISKNEAGQRFDKFLQKYLPFATMGFLYKMLRKKNITLNGKKADGREILSVGDVVESFFSEETFAKFAQGTQNYNREASGDGIQSASERSFTRGRKPVSGEYSLQAFRQLGKISILYEDEDILILDKPAGILSQKASPADLSLNEWLVGYLIDKGEMNPAQLKTFRPSVCNRLDQNTSGIVLCGKSLLGTQFLSELIRDRQIRKFYRTICIGKIVQDMILEGELEKDAGRNRVYLGHVQSSMNSSIPGKMPGKNPDAGQEEGQFPYREKENPGREDIRGEGISADMPRKKTFRIRTGIVPLAACGNYTYLEVELFTGKSHQIRAHLAEIGHPLVGDVKYGNPKENRFFKNTYGLKNQLLHAYRVEFPDILQEKFQKHFSHLSGKVVIAALPAKFDEILEDLGSNCF